jgi:hypothetical protein
MIKDMAPIVAAIISSIATILVGLLTIFGKDFLEKWKSKKSLSANILGLWQCDWYIINSSGIEEFYTTDTVNINKIIGRELQASGHNAISEYTLTGHISIANIITLLYKGTNNRMSLTGTVILEVSPVGNQMQGQWFGYTRNAKIQGGRTIWKLREI